MYSSLKEAPLKLRISEQGEILFSGTHGVRKTYNDRRSWSASWFHTSEARFFTAVKTIILLHLFYMFALDTYINTYTRSRSRSQSVEFLSENAAHNNSSTKIFWSYYTCRLRQSNPFYWFKIFQVFYRGFLHEHGVNFYTIDSVS